MYPELLGVLRPCNTARVGITALSFDADQTLWDFSEVQKLALESTISLMVAEGIVEEGSVTPEDLQRIRQDVVTEFRGRPHRLEEVREASFARFLEVTGHATPASTATRIAEHFLVKRFDHIRLFPDVAPVMARLKTSYRIGLLTNGNTYPDRCGLPDTFHAQVLGPDHGFEKPAVEAFAMLADLLGVELDSMAHIGDDWDDIEGANSAGCVSILIDRDNRRPDFAADADHVIADLDELERLLITLA